MTWQIRNAYESPSHRPGRQMMKVHSEDFRVQEDDDVGLDEWPTRAEPVYKSDEEYQELPGEHVEKLSSLPQVLHASGRHAILLIFQAMDAAGKDGAVKHVMSGVNLRGCRVFGSKHSTAVEPQHDFLWRTTRELPGRGCIGIFNRSHHEEALIAQVQPEILKNENIPDEKQRGKGIRHHRHRSVSYVVHADGKENARLIASKILLDTLDDLNMAYPVSSDERRTELLAIRKELVE